jgi:spermidine synthase
MKKTLPLTIIGVGFTAIAAQIVFVREFLAFFSADELSIGLILASWLAGGAIGAFLLVRLTEKIKPGYFVFWLTQIAMVFLLPSGILLVRSARQLLGINPGQIVPFHIIGWASLVILFPICAALSFMFSFSCKLYGSKRRSGSASIGMVYGLESLGSMAGGLLVSFCFIRFLSSFEIILVLSLLNALAALFLIRSYKRSRPRLIILNGLIILVLIFSWGFKSWDKLGDYSLKRQWPGYELLASRNSLYGNIVVLERGGGISLFENGSRLYTVPDRLASEEAVHFGLLEHKAPKDVLLLGGGSGGLLTEILKHPLQHVDYLELDPMVIKMSKEFLPSGFSAALDNPRVSVVNLDARYFMKRNNQKYDCIIVHLGDPITAQLNRFYTAEFFQEASGHLKPGGIICVNIGASESYIGEDMANYLRSIYATLKTAFLEVKAIPGETAYFLAARTRGILTYDYRLLMQRARERNLDLKYVREYYLFSRFSEEKIAYFEQILSQEKGIKINRDFQPSAYYYSIISRAGRLGDSAFLKILKAVDEKMIWVTFGIILMALPVLSQLKRRKTLVLISVAAMGFSQLAIQVMLLFSFQVIYGYLFYKLGVLFTFFMLGLALASWWAASRMDKSKVSREALIWAQLAIFIFALALPLFLRKFSGGESQLLGWLGSNLLFPGLSLLSGLLAGILFGLANKIYLEETGSKDYGRVSGLTYGFDLLGSCLGSSLSAIFMVPILGIEKSCLVLALLNLTVSAMLVFSAPHRQK